MTPPSASAAPGIAPAGLGRIMPVLKVVRVLVYLTVMAIFIAAFGYDVDVVVRYWPALLCWSIATAIVCDLAISLHAGTLAIGAVVLTRAAHPRLLVIMAVLNLGIAGWLAVIGANLLAQRLP